MREAEPRLMYQSLIVGRLRTCLGYLDDYATANPFQSGVIAKKLVMCVDSLIDLSIPSLRKEIMKRLRRAKNVANLQLLERLCTESIMCVEYGKFDCKDLEQLMNLLRSHGGEEVYQKLDRLRSIEHMGELLAYLNLLKTLSMVQLSKAKIRIIIDVLEDAGLITKNDLVLSGSPDAHSGQPD